MKEHRLKDKNILLVDDEPDVLDTLADLLPMCNVKKASTFETATEYLETRSFDIAILDIMGVDGYQLLDLAKNKGVIPVILTAHALSVEDTVKSFKNGAAFYLPKDEMRNIVVYLTDILEAEEKGKKFWWRWMERLETYYDKKFGPNWKKEEKDFWDNFNFPT